METSILTNNVNGVEINTKNRRSAREMVTAQGDLNIIKNPKTGKLFFKCGGTQGYISPKAVSAISRGCTLDDLKVAEVQIPSKSTEWIPTLMVVGNSEANVVTKFTLAD